MNFRDSYGPVQLGPSLSGTPGMGVHAETDTVSETDPLGCGPGPMSFPFQSRYTITSGGTRSNTYSSPSGG